MNERPEIVWLSQSNPANYDDYNYALCKCCVHPESIKFPKAGVPTFYQFECPRCGETVGYVELVRKEI